MTTLFLGTMPLILSCLCGMACGQPWETNPTDPALITSQLTRSTYNWLANRSLPPGARAEMRETGRENRDDGLWVRYHLYVTGVPKDRLYNVRQWPISAPRTVALMEGVSIASDGLVTCAGTKPGQCRGEKPDDAVEFTFHGAEAEPYRLDLVAWDENISVPFGVVPDPIAATDKGCKLEVIRLLPKFEAAMLRGSGFEPNQDLAFSSTSYGETHEAPLKANSEGRIVSALSPFVKNKLSGKTDLSVKGATCDLKLSFEWGK